MIPDFDVRIASIVKAIEDNVLSAIAGDRPLAREQATLAVGHLKIMAEQWSYVESHAARCLADSIAFGRDLLASVASDALAYGPLARALDEAGRARPIGARATWAIRNTVASATTAAIDRLAVGPDDLWDKITPIVLRHARREHDRDRAWFAGYGLDSEASTLPSIAELLSDGRTLAPQVSVA
jgi:hypothetical protein